MTNPTGSGPGKNPQKPTMARYALWIIVGGVALVLIVQGVIGILAGGS
ncbi:hypothetical protein [Planctomonas deserti]|jgi:hypothetical protein|nr:hypothetical protein [Planctomonas deserti]